jgi:hypothetical protein
MIPNVRVGALSLLLAVCLTAACGLPRPDTVVTRMIEPRLAESSGVVADAPNAASVRLLDTQIRAHIGRRLLHQQPDGELTEDDVWRWTSTPDRYLDSALRLAIASNPELRQVDASSASSLAVTVLAWQIESGSSRRLIGAVEIKLTRPDRTVYSQIIRAEEALSADLPGDLSAAAGRLLGRLASDCLSHVARQQGT